MSKPKPGLGKGIVRTLQQHPPLNTTPIPLQLAPNIGPSHRRSSSSSVYISPPSRPTTAYLSLLPTWDSFSSSDTTSDIVQPYTSKSRSYSTSRVLPIKPMLAQSYSTSTAALRNAFDFSMQSILEQSPFHPSLFIHPSHRHGEAFTDPLPSNFPPPPSPSPPPQTTRSPRPTESEQSSLSSTPLATSSSTSSSSSPSHVLSAQPFLSVNKYRDPPGGIPIVESPDTPATNTYSSKLIFHLGASGSAKERVSPPRSASSRAKSPTPPPRPRSFPLPNVTPPTHLHSTGVGEDAYFARIDGMCIADGVGGWAASGRGGADAGRWSRLLTHFCEVEVAAWWAGAEHYVIEGGKADSGHYNPLAGKNPWTWKTKRGQTDDDSQGLPTGQTRRPLDPVEIMQTGFEKCLACVAAEGIHGSSTCLLALLHHSTLLIANLGDCSLLVIRAGEVVFRTKEMQHAFNFPLQVGTHSRDEPMKDAERNNVAVERNDIVVVGSDGLMDNLYEEDILDTLATFALPSVDGTSTSSLPAFSPQLVSDALCQRAKAVSSQTTADTSTPFRDRAGDEGIDFLGGKKDGTFSSEIPIL
ncbi:protein phosphatase PTC7, partial [Tremellales sp. Uapishka_1]